MHPQSPQPNLDPDDAGQFSSPKFWLILVVTGAAAGLAGGVLMRLLFFVEHHAWHFSTGDFLDGVIASAPRTRVFNLMLAGIFVGVAGFVIKHLFAKPGGDVESAIWFDSGQVPFFSTFCRQIVSIISVGLGTSLGRESPIKQAGGAIASTIARWARLSPQQRQLLVASGVGAGMAASYNVPLGGGLFAVEVLIGSMSLRKILPAMVASVVATAASWLLLPNRPNYLVPEFTSSSSLLVWAILAGPVLGIAAVAMVRATAWGGQKLTGAWQSVLSPILVLTLLGVLAIQYPQLLGNGKDTVQRAFANRFSISLLLFLPILKIITTTASLRCGARGGLFTPTMMVGALLGGALGHVWSMVWPVTDPKTYAVVGACAVLAAATRGPLSALVLVLELTRHIDATMAPMVLAAAGATMFAGRFESRVDLFSTGNAGEISRSNSYDEINSSFDFLLNSADQSCVYDDLQMLPAIPNPLVQFWFHWYCRHALRKFFHRVHLYGDVPFEPDRSIIYLANHASFWDVIVLNYLIHARRRRPAYCMSDLVQMKKHPFFRRVGAFSVDRTNPRDALRSIQYAADLLNRSPCAVVIFPQGRIEPADQRPLNFERGITRLVTKSPASQVIIVSLRYEFWLDQRAELLIDLSVADDRSIDAMQLQMTTRLEMLAAAGREFRPGNQILLEGRKSISEWRWR